VEGFIPNVEILEHFSNLQMPYPVRMKHTGQNKSPLTLKSSKQFGKRLLECVWLKVWVVQNHPVLPAVYLNYNLMDT